MSDFPVNQIYSDSGYLRQEVVLASEYILGEVTSAKRGFPRLLDTGCGNGELLLRLSQAGYPREKLWGLDIEPGHIELARQRTQLDNFICSDLLEYVIDCDENYGIVTALGWIHNDWAWKHATGIPKRPQPRKAIHTLAVEGLVGLLAPGGILIIDWPNPDEQREPVFQGISLRGDVFLVGRLGSKVGVFKKNEGNDYSGKEIT